MSKVAVIAGSFDPITYGHLWMLEKSLDMFDAVHIVIATNTSKKSRFTAEERYQLIINSIEDTPQLQGKNYFVDNLPSHLMLVDYAKYLGATHIVRGIRNTTDFEYEAQLNLINKQIVPDIETVFLMPRRDLIEVSSSMVKGLVGLAGWEAIAKKYVPSTVIDALST